MLIQGPLLYHPQFMSSLLLLLFLEFLTSGVIYSSHFDLCCFSQSCTVGILSCSSLFWFGSSVFKCHVFFFLGSEGLVGRKGSDSDQYLYIMTEFYHSVTYPIPNIIYGFAGSYLLITSSFIISKEGIREKSM